MGETTEDKLAWLETMTQIRLADQRDLEALWRKVSLHDLPPRQGRERELANLIGTPVSEGLHVVAHLHAAMRRTPGHICEFGVAQGATSALLAAEIMNTDRKLFLFDSFEGLPAPSDKDVLLHDIFNLGSMSAYQGQMASPESEVLGRLADVKFPLDRTVIRKGWVNETLVRGPIPDVVAFAYVDLDFYEPIRDALAFMHLHTSPGARVVIDDYGYFSSGAKTAADEFVASTHGHWLVELPEAPANGFIALVRAG